ncbi:uncharacterized protein V6R79_001943 [Siganus canaliculatus]
MLQQASIFISSQWEKHKRLHIDVFSRPCNYQLLSPWRRSIIGTRQLCIFNGAALTNVHPSALKMTHTAMVGFSRHLFLSVGVLKASYFPGNLVWTQLCGPSEGRGKIAQAEYKKKKKKKQQRVEGQFADNAADD